MVESASATVLLPSTNIQPNSAEVSTPLANTLHLTHGDYVTIRGKRFTVAPVEIVKGEGYFIRPDTYTRQSSGATLNATVEVSKVEKVVEGFRIVLTMAEGSEYPDSDEIKSLLLGTFLAQGQFVACNFCGDARLDAKDNSCHDLVFTIIETKPSLIVKVTKNTEVIMSKDAEAISTVEVSYNNIGGLCNTIDRLRTITTVSLSSSEFFSQFRIPKYRGILLIGQAGTGKTLTTNALLQETGAYRVPITPDRLSRDGPQQAAMRLREKFAEGKEHAPSIITFEKIDRICRKSEGYSSPELDLATTLANEFDSLGDSKVIVIASANSREAIDPILLTAGRFDKEILFDPPNKEGRCEILEILTRELPLDADVDLHAIAERTHGFTGADIEGLCTDALYESIGRHPSSLRPTGELAERARHDLAVSMRDFIAALKTRKASCGRAYIRETVHVAWDKVGGLDNVKAEIEKDVIWPNRYRQLAIQLGVKPPAGIILYGPPGTGKSYLARAISTRLQWPIIWKRGAELRSKYLGETQKNLEALFNAAMINAPSTLLVEEFDSLGSKRMAGGDAAQREIDNAVNTIIESIDRIIEAQSQVLLIFTTNRIDMLDDALLRSGRVDGHYYIGPPDEAGRESIFLIYAKNYQTGDIDYKELAKNTEGFTPADIKRVWEEASRICFASSILKHESLSKATSFNGLEDGSPKRTSVPETSIETDPVTMRDLTTVIEKLRSQNLKRRM